MKEFFLAHIYTELQLIEEALQKYQSLIDAGFSKSTYIISQIAVAYHNIRGQRNIWGLGDLLSCSLPRLISAVIFDHFGIPLQALESVWGNLSLVKLATHSLRHYP